VTRLEHCLELVGDIRDCAMRARDLCYPSVANYLCLAADAIENESKRDERPSMPPVLASNQEARATASKHFQEARRLLKGIR
jgi:hypothetical protein